jgi:hypothetical protein
MLAETDDDLSLSGGLQLPLVLDPAVVRKKTGLS